MMDEKSRQQTQILATITGLFGLGLFVTLLWVGVARFSEQVMPYIIGGMPVLVVLGLCAFTPLAFWGGSREMGIALLSVTLGLWRVLVVIVSIVVAKLTLGLFWTILGCLSGLVGIIPVAIVGAIIRGYWSELGLLVFTVLMTIVTNVPREYAIRKLALEMAHTPGPAKEPSQQEMVNEISAQVLRDELETQESARQFQLLASQVSARVGKPVIGTVEGGRAYFHPEFLAELRKPGREALLDLAGYL